MPLGEKKRIIKNILNMFYEKNMFMQKLFYLYQISKEKYLRVFYGKRYLILKMLLISVWSVFVWVYINTYFVRNARNKKCLQNFRISQSGMWINFK